MPARRLLLLAEGFSGDPHYGKTMRGVMRYRRDDVVAILDSERAGVVDDGVPVVADVNASLRFEPTVALVGVATQGGNFPPAWRELLKACIRQGLAIENGLHEFVADDEELVALAARFRVTLTDLRRPPAGLNVPTGANLELPARIVLTVGSDCAIGKMTVSLELEREARGRGLAHASSPRAKQASPSPGGGSPSTRWSRISLPGRRSAWSSRGTSAGESCSSSKAKERSRIPPTRVSPSASSTARRRMRSCSVTWREQRRWRAIPGHPLMPLPGLVELHERSRWPAGRPVACIALNTSALADEAARAAIARAEVETGLVADDPVRFGSARLLDAVLTSLPGG